MIGGRGGWIVSVVGGNEQQVVLPEGRQQAWQGAVERFERSLKPSNIVAMPVQLVEIYQIREAEPTRWARKPLQKLGNPLGVVGRVMGSE